MKQVLNRRGAALTVSSIILGSALLLPGAAMAGKGQAGSGVNFSGVKGEQNIITVTTSFDTKAHAVITDAGAVAPVASTGCAKVDAVSISCDSKNKKVVVNVRDGDDSVTGKGDSVFSMIGGTGNDSLRGGNAADTIRAGSGDDKIYAVDGKVDKIDCGAGVDTVYGDMVDGKTTEKANVKNCERFEVEPSVDLPKPPDDDPSTGTGDTSSYPGSDDSTGGGNGPDSGSCTGVKAVGKSASVKKRSVKIKLSAPSDATTTCTGSFQLDTAIVRAGSKKVQKVKLGSARFNLSPGKSATLKLKLSKRGAKVVKKFKKVQSRLTVYTDSQVSASTFTSKTFTLKLKKARKKH